MAVFYDFLKIGCSLSTYQHSIDRVIYVVCVESALTHGDPVNEGGPQCSGLNGLSSSSGRLPVASHAQAAHLIHRLPLSFCPLSFRFAASLSSPETLPSLDVPGVRQLQFCPFCSQRCLRRNLLQDPPAHLPGSPGYPWSCASNAIFEMKQIPPRRPISHLHSPTFHIHT